MKIHYYGALIIICLISLLFFQVSGSCQEEEGWINCGTDCIPKTGTVVCCGQNSYDFTNQTCIDNTIYDGLDWKKCGDNVYNTTYQYCENEIVKTYDRCGDNNLSFGMKCCGDSVYNPNIQICCDNKSYFKKDYYTCNAVENQKTESIDNSQTRPITSQYYPQSSYSPSSVNYYCSGTCPPGWSGPDADCNCYKWVYTYS